MLCSITKVGTNVFRMPNSRTTIVIKSLKMSPFEFLCGRKCRTPLYWHEIGEDKVFGPDVLRDAERKVRIVRENLKLAQSRKKSYADNRRRDLSFEVRDFVYLKVSPMRGLKRFKVRGKLAPRYIGPFKILERRGEVAYQLELPPQLFIAHKSAQILNGIHAKWNV